MAIEYTWTIAMTEYTNDDDKGILVVHYRVNAVEGEYTASTYGTCSYTPDASSQGYIPFADLTEATVVGWVKESLGEDTVQDALASQIEAQKAPVSIAGMPWTE